MFVHKEPNFMVDLLFQLANSNKIRYNHTINSKTLVVRSIKAGETNIIEIAQAICWKVPMINFL